MGASSGYIKAMDIDFSNRIGGIFCGGLAISHLSAVSNVSVYLSSSLSGL